ncbi:MAG TPA: MBOAT family O-acyltransferase [Chitinophagaceae bacterium]|nr:MBOAT family O-acyltransferase [Chitinophagaceae bacterium]
MLFNSIDFLFFFAIVFPLFYFLPGPYRKILLFVSSCIFYMWFIPYYIFILFVTILIDFFAAIQIEDRKKLRVKKYMLLLGIINTCLVLFFFKYYNFFIESFNFLGLTRIPHLDIILPVGLSFHVFQSLSYVIEVYRGNIKAERNLLVYANYVMMFPQLVAGPIERAQNMLPQLRTCNHKITYQDFLTGFTRFFWGLFKKLVVADTLGSFVDSTYNNYGEQSGGLLLLATVFFAIQIYCDFSGYSDMAIGVARMLGFRFRENFNLPYFATSITDFWRRWHISLSTWLRDYLYIPLGGNRNGKLATYKNIMLTMLLGGLWHGASWNFIIWGGLHGVYLSFEKAFSFGKRKIKNIFSKIVGWLITFTLVCFAWIFFRAIDLHQANEIIRRIFTDSSYRNILSADKTVLSPIINGIFLLLIIEWLIIRKFSFDAIFEKKYGEIILVAFSTFLILYIFLFGNSNNNQFIYFQF